MAKTTVGRTFSTNAITLGQASEAFRLRCQAQNLSAGTLTLPITETDPVAISEIEPPAEARLPTAFENNAGVVELVAADAAKTLSKCDGGRRVRRDGRRGSAGAAGHFCAYG